MAIKENGEEKERPSGLYAVGQPTWEKGSQGDPMAKGTEGSGKGSVSGCEGEQT